MMSDSRFSAARSWSASKYFLLVTAGFTLPVVLTLLDHSPEPEMEKVWPGLVGALGQGGAFGLMLVIPMLHLYFPRESRNMDYVGMYYCFGSGLLMAGPPVYLLLGYPAVWSILKPLVAIFLLTFCYIAMTRHSKKA